MNAFRASVIVVFLAETVLSMPFFASRDPVIMCTILMFVMAFSFLMLLLVFGLASKQKGDMKAEISPAMLNNLYFDARAMRRDLDSATKSSKL